MRFFVLVLCCLLYADLALADAARPNLKNLDKPIELHAGDVPRMYVVFNHSSHKRVACRNCHHDGLPGNRYASCTNPECHAITSPSSREPLSVYMAFHAPDMRRSCQGCHKMETKTHPEFRGCKPCHQSMASRQAMEKIRQAKASAKE